MGVYLLNHPSPTATGGMSAVVWIIMMAVAVATMVISARGMGLAACQTGRYYERLWRSHLTIFRLGEAQIVALMVVAVLRHFAHT